MGFNVFSEDILTSEVGEVGDLTSNHLTTYLPPDSEPRYHENPVYRMLILNCKPMYPQNTVARGEKQTKTNQVKQRLTLNLTYMMLLFLIFSLNYKITKILIWTHHNHKLSALSLSPRGITKQPNKFSETFFFFSNLSLIIALLSCLSYCRFSHSASFPG